MKKSVIIPVIFLTSLALVGCSPFSKTETSDVDQEYTFSKNIWISKDSGRTWKESNVATNKPRLTDIDPLRLVFDPKNPNIAYAGLRTGGIMKTVNGGESWEFLTFKTDKVYGLAVNQNNSEIIYASTAINNRGKIFKNSASGATDSWTEIYTTAVNGPVVSYLVTDKKNPNTIYVATSDKQVLKSLDGGVSWSNIFSSQSPIIKISLDAKDSNLVYLLAQNGEVFSSSEDGEKFESLTKKIYLNGIFGYVYSVMEADPMQSKEIYLAGKTGIIRSKDAGNKWEIVLTLNNPENSPIGAIAINPQNSQEIIYGASQATYHSLDGGKTWEPTQFDLPKVVSSLEYNPLDPNIVYATFSGK